MSDQYPYPFGRYQLEAEIGRGAFGNVYRALDTRLKRPVAIKVLDPIYMRDRKWIDRFNREAIVMAQLDHPHIVPIYDTGEFEGRIFLAMKQVEDGNLEQFIRDQGSLSWREVLALMQQITSAVDYAHKRDILHRDLKPANILLEDDRALLTDFGLARLVESNSMSMSMHGGMVGTYHYMAPELFHNNLAEPATDIYALGCILYEMVTGNILFDGDSMAAIIGAHLRPLELPESFGDDTPPGFAEVLHVALAKDPAGRYQTGAELFAALENIEANRLVGPYANLEQALADEDWATALELAETIQTTDVHYRDIRALRARAEAGQERALKRKWAERWRREAETALAQDDEMTAQIALNQWRQVAPDDPAVGQFAGRLALLLQYQKLVQAIEEQNWEIALSLVEAIYAADNDFRDIKNLRRQAQAAHELAQQEQHTTKQPPHLRVVLSVKPEQVNAGEEARWTLTVRNDGGVDLFKVEVHRNGNLFTRSFDLAKGKGRRFSFKTVYQTDGEKREMVTVCGNTEDGESVEEEVTTSVQVIAARQKPRPEPKKMPEAAPKTAQTALPEKIEVPAPVVLAPDPLIIYNVGGLEFIEIPAGEFWMGSDDGDKNEEPQHKVYLDSYRIGRTPVTYAQYRLFLEATGREIPKQWQKEEGWIIKRRVVAFPEEKTNHPAVFISWEDAQAYCRWLSAKTGLKITLPTEAQWEKAARGPKGLVYPWGNRFYKTRCNMRESGYGDTTPVDQHPQGASPYGVLDMSGNVWEWVRDWYTADYSSHSQEKNPPGPINGEYKVLRGGSWYSFRHDMRAANRSHGDPASRYYYIGFRCAQET